MHLYFFTVSTLDWFYDDDDKKYYNSKTS